MKITFDPTKRVRTLTERRLDMARADEVFAGRNAVVPDGRFNYGEDRYLTAGFLDGRMVILVWTPDGDGDDRRIISMRHCHADEEARWLKRMG
ncbi:MAG: BrnT family toxin [Bauldia sp.]|nr:BrnT family toxin [Bauldia sp.]